jgi:hypothetical protein
MARGNAKAQDLKSGQSVKAGRKKSYKQPPPVNKDKQDRRMLGEQQFQSKVNFTEEVTVIKFKDGRMVSDTKHVPIPYKYDPTRKRVIFNSFWNPGKDGNGRAPR